MMARWANRLLLPAGGCPVLLPLLLPRRPGVLLLLLLLLLLLRRVSPPLLLLVRLAAPDPPPPCLAPLKAAATAAAAAGEEEAVVVEEGLWPPGPLLLLSCSPGSWANTIMSAMQAGRAAAALLAGSTHSSCGRHETSKDTQQSA
jgi:hypothetical protein